MLRQMVRGIGDWVRRLWWKLMKWWLWRKWCNDHRGLKTYTFQYTRPAEYATDAEWKAALTEKMRAAIEKIKFCPPWNKNPEYKIVCPEDQVEQIDEMIRDTTTNNPAATFKDWTQYR